MPRRHRAPRDARCRQSTLTADDEVTWGDIEKRDDNYRITEDSTPAKLGSSLGWLLQLDGDNLRNAFLNAPWVKAVIPIRPGRESAALNWLRAIEGHEHDGWDTPYSCTAEDEDWRGARRRDASHDRQRARAIADRMEKENERHRGVLERGQGLRARFDHLAGGFDAGLSADQVFSQWISVLPTDQIVARRIRADDAVRAVTAMGGEAIAPIAHASLAEQIAAVPALELSPPRAVSAGLPSHLPPITAGTVAAAIAAFEHAAGTRTWSGAGGRPPRRAAEDGSRADMRAANRIADVLLRQFQEWHRRGQGTFPGNVGPAVHALIGGAEDAARRLEAETRAASSRSRDATVPALLTGWLTVWVNNVNAAREPFEIAAGERPLAGSTIALVAEGHLETIGGFVGAHPGARRARDRLRGGPGQVALLGTAAECRRTHLGRVRRGDPERGRSGDPRRRHRGDRDPSGGPAGAREWRLLPSLEHEQSRHAHAQVDDRDAPPARRGISRSCW